MKVRHLLVASVATVVVVVGLSACVSVAETAPRPTESLSPTPEATAEPVPLGAIAPFGGSCESVTDVGALSAAVGAEVSIDAEVSNGGTGVGTLGGLNCIWRTEDLSGIRLSAFPIAVLTPELQTKYAEQVCEGYLYDGSGCRVAISNDDVWMLISADDFQGDAGQGSAAARLAAVRPLFEAALATTVPSRAATRTDEWWAAASCEQIAARLPLATILGSEDFESGYPSGFGTDVQYELAVEKGTTIDCKWYSPSSAGLPAVLITAYPGGAWDWDRTVEAAKGRGQITDVVVGGATSAFTAVGGIRPDGSFLAASDGVNMLVLLEAPDPVMAGELVIAALAGRA